MSVDRSVANYIALQPKLTWRRHALRGFIRFVFTTFFRVQVTGVENIPSQGGGIVMINHISLLDPVLGMGWVRPRFVIPMTKAENMENPTLAFFINWWGSYSVNRGEVDRKALNNSIELIKSGQLILLAPEGTRQKNGMAEAKDGLTYIATKADAIIIPMGISGAQTWWSDLKAFKRARIRVHFGRPFRFRTEGRARIPREELTAMTEEAMYQLASAVPDEALRGIYSDLTRASTNHLEFL
jgi:1-acyl-sn-glycerol-3-phosphate acyltransferase